MLHPEKKPPLDDEVDGGLHVLNLVSGVLNRAPSKHHFSRPRITLTYAQSLDGCVSANAGSKTRISNSACQVFTHHLRSIHDAILVGVTTVLVDNPRLNVRLVGGNDPTPVIVDSRLRTPPDAHVLHHDNTEPIIFTTESACPVRAARLADAGVQVVRVAAGSGGRVDLSNVFRCLVDRGVGSVMVEGGAKVITSVLLGCFADQLVLTLAPMILGGVHAVDNMHGIPPDLRPRLKSLSVEPVAGDLILHGEFERLE
ncbi:MAG: RibD family protein [Gammaproteobacteria bacterium]|nr:RibD family protein [Gammaproteobacteria bacterium]MDH3469186.1 RibD family protein [Gammaproteobacteria bacterium]